MLSFEVMGALALGAFWVNLLLIAAAALKKRSALGGRLAQLESTRAKGGLVEGEVAASERVFAERRVAQVGRAMTALGPDRILFTDKRALTQVRGGSIVCKSGVVEVSPDADCEVWIGPSVPAVRDLPFEQAWQSASTSRGVELDALQRVEAGTRVWVAGERVENSVRPRLIATACPVGTLRRARRTLLGAALLSITGGVGVTALVLVPPVFGTVSTLGGALGLVFFLLIQPAGVAAGDAARMPTEQPLGGVWQRG